MIAKLRRSFRDVIDAEIFKQFMIKKLFKHVWIFLYLVFIFNIQADVKLPKGIGPVASSSSHMVERQGSVEVSLSATAKNGINVFEFSIFDMPKNGDLLTADGKVIKNDVIRYLGDSISLRYVPKNDTAISDEFTYRARIRGGKYSSPSKISIQIIEPAAKFSTADILNFGRVGMYKTVIKELELKNESTNVIKISTNKLIKFSYLNKIQEIELLPNRSFTIPIKFNSEDSIGIIREKLILSSGAIQKEVNLSALVTEPFQLSSKNIVLKKLESRSYRSSQIALSNNLDEEITININEREQGVLNFQKLIRLSAGATKSLDISLENSHPNEYESELFLNNGQYTRSLKVTARALPPYVIINGNKKFISANSRIGEALIFDIPITNSGGLPVDVSINLVEGFKLNETDSETVNIKPGDIKIIKLSYSAKDIGLKNCSIGFNWENKESYIKFKLDIKDAIKRPEASNSKKLPKNQLNLKDSYPKSLLLDVETERNVSTELSTVKDIKVIKTGKQQVEFSWDKKPEELNFVVETRVHRLNKEKGLIQFHWIELDDDYLTISQNGSEVKALIKGLSPSGRYTIRVISKNKNNEFSAPSEPFQFSTKESFELNGRVILNLIGLTAGVFLVSFYLLRFIKARSL